MVRTYSLRRDGNKKLSEHFRVREFACHDGSDKILISDETVAVLEKIRTYFGKPVTITSGYRTAAYNASPKVGGAKNSQHVKGTACDIKVQGVPSWAVAGYLESFHHGGIGYYSTFTHVDSRGYRVLWKDYGSNVKGTFGIGKNYELFKAKPVPNPVQEEEMTDKEVYEAFIRYSKTLTLPTWAVKEFNEAKAAGITDGSDPCALIPRYQAAIMALRASKK